MRHLRLICLLVAIVMGTVGIAAAQSATIRNADISDQSLEGKVIEESTLSRTTVRASTIRDSQVANANIDRTTVERSDLRETLVTNSTVRDSTVEGTTLRGITIESSSLSKVLVEKALMTDGSLTDATVRDSTLDRVERTRVSLCNVFLRDEGRTETSGCTNAQPPGRGPTDGGGGTGGGPTQPPGGTSIFSRDDRTLAILEFNGDARDSSGNGRDAYINGPARFTPTRFGQGLAIASDGPTVDWSTYATTLRHPFTIEMVITPSDTTGYRKLFGDDNNRDAGWYILNSGLRFYSDGATLSEGRITPNANHYLAFVSTSPNTLDVYVNGAYAGTTPMTFIAPPNQALFLRDDRGGSEQFIGTIDALRISNTARTTSEINNVDARVR